MLAPIKVEIIPIAMMITARLMTWIVTMARSAIFVPMKVDSRPRDEHFLGHGTDQVFTQVAAGRVGSLSANGLY